MTINDLKVHFKQGLLSKPDFIQEALSNHHRVLFDYVKITQSTDVREIHIGRDGVAFVIGQDAIRLYAPPDEARVAPLEVMNFDQYEPHETRVMDLCTENVLNILDIGANIGWHACRFAKRLPDARVFAFEPLPESFFYLQKNVALNQVGNRVITFNYGLSDTDGVVRFHITPTSSVNASLKNVAHDKDAVRVVGFTITLDQWVTNYGVIPGFIKCDVEGAELLVFRGGRNTLLKNKPVVFSELLRKWSKPYGYHPNDMLNYFKGLGYTCWAVSGDGIHSIDAVTEDTVETNYVFLHKQAHSTLINKLIT